MHRYLQGPGTLPEILLGEGRREEEIEMVEEGRTREGTLNVVAALVSHRMTHALSTVSPTHTHTHTIAVLECLSCRLLTYIDCS